MLAPTMLFRSLAAVALGSLALTSCSGSGMTPSAPAAGQTAPVTTPANQHVIPNAGGSSAVYVSDSWGKSVFRFARNPDGTLVTPAGSSLVLGYAPGPIAVGASGKLFVTDQSNETLEVYPKMATGYQAATRTLILPFLPSCVAVDRQGYEYVGGLSNGYVAVYAPNAKGTASTIQRIALPDRHPTINGVAIDAAGNLYVSDTNEVSEFSTPATNPTLKRAIIGTGQQNVPSGLALDNRELYAANSGDGNVLAYSPTANGKSAPDRTISSTNPSLVTPVGVAAVKNVLYVTSGSKLYGTPSIFVLNAQVGAQKPIQVVTGSYLASPVGVAVGP